MNHAIQRVIALLVGVMLLATACGRHQEVTQIQAIGSVVDEQPEEAATPQPTVQVETEIPTPASRPHVKPDSPGWIVPDGGRNDWVEPEAPTTAPTATPGPTATPTPEPVQVWVDLPVPQFVRIKTAGVYAPVEVTTADNKSFDPDGPNVGVLIWEIDGPDGQKIVRDIGPCEFGTSWVLGHSHATGATPGLVIHPQDHADQALIELGWTGVQLGDHIVWEFADGNTCTYEVVPFGETLTGRDVVSVSGSPAVAYEKERFCPQSAESGLPHPWGEWDTPDDESVMYFSTSGGWPTITKCNGKTGRPDVDTVKAVLVESTFPPVYVTPST